MTVTRARRRRRRRASGARRRRAGARSITQALDRAARRARQSTSRCRWRWWRRSRACITVGEGVSDPEALWRALAPGLDAGARRAASAARAREGEALAPICARGSAALETMQHDLARADRARRPITIARSCAIALERALKPGEVDPQRLAQEIAILADKADVTEELTRLAAHLDRVRAARRRGRAPSGRRLDFLTQELNREVNTIGAKSQSAHVRGARRRRQGRVERLREQIQNVEVSMEHATKPRGLLLVVSSPSGAGKTTLCHRLIAEFPEVVFSVSYTTRPMRRGEEDGVDYHFVDDATFDAMVDERRVRRVGRTCTATATARPSPRCARRSRADATCSSTSTTRAAASSRRAFEREAVLVFVLPPSLEVLERAPAQARHRRARGDRAPAHQGARRVRSSTASTSTSSSTTTCRAPTTGCARSTWRR